jgi:hypothetical protein
MSRDVAPHAVVMASLSIAMAACAPFAAATNGAAADGGAAGGVTAFDVDASADGGSSDLGNGDAGNADGSATSLVGVASCTTNTCVRVVAVGDYFACSLRGDEHLFCWGRNDSGQLGAAAANPGPVTENSQFTGRPIAQLALGGGHACVRLVDATVHCWVKAL